MKFGRLVFEHNSKRFVALDRDHRNECKCYGCWFALRPAFERQCPQDKDKNLLCKFGHGFIFKPLQPAAPVIALRDRYEPEQLTLIEEDEHDAHQR